MPHFRNSNSCIQVNSGRIAKDVNLTSRYKAGMDMSHTNKESKTKVIQVLPPDLSVK